MEDKKKTKPELLKEISELHNRIKKLENAENKYKKTENELFHSREMLQLILDTIPQRVFWKDLECNYIGCNLKFAQDAHLETQFDIIGKNDFDLSTKEVANSYRDDDRRVIETDSPKLNYEEFQIKPDGSHKWLKSCKVPLHGRDGKVIGILGTYEDITEQKQVEENLRREKILLRTLINNIPDAIFAKDTDGRKIIANLADLNNMGCNSEDEAIGRTDFDFFPKEIAEGFYANDHSVINTGNPILKREEFFIDKLGKKTWLHTSKLPLRNEKGNIIGLIGIGRDITEQKIAQETLQKERILLRTLIDHLPDAIYVKDTECRKTLSNSADLRNIGKTDESEVLGKTDFDFYSKEIAQKFYEDDQDVIKNNKGVLNREEYFINSEGKQSWLLTSKLPLMDENGKVTGLIGIGRDITNQKLSQEALHKERILLRTVIDNIPDAVYVKDTEYRKTIANSTDVRNLGKESEAELLNKTDYDIFPKEIADGFYADDLSVIKEGKTILNREEFFMDKDGKRSWLLTSKLPLYDDKGVISGMVGIGRDITEQKHFEEALKNERNFLRTLIDNLPDLIYFKDNKARYVLNNLAHMQSLGAEKQEDLLGKNTYDFNPYELAKVYFNDEMNIVKTGKPILDKEEVAVHQNTGEYLWHLTSKLPIYKDGEVSGILCVSRDITQQKIAQEALQNERNQLRTLIDSLPDLIFFKDLEGRYILNNYAHLQFIGSEKQEDVYGKTAHDFHPEEVAERFFIEEKEVLKSGKPMIEIEQVMHHKKRNEDLCYLVSKIPLLDKDGKAKGILGVGYDITNRKRSEEALHQTYDELEQTNRDLKKANKIKGQFLANMSHEIRTPLNAVIGMTGLLLDTALNDEQRDYAETILNSGDILLSLINDILDFSKIEAQKIELEKQPFDVRNCIEEALDLVASRAADKNLELAYSIDEGLSTNVIGDVTRMRQILVNLLSNSIKFTEKGEVVVSVSGQLQDHYSYMLHFKVRDTGIGIPKDRQGKLFQSFTQVDASTTRKFGGTGLGLAISRQLSELMGGTMWFESSGISGEGTIFHFTILTELSIEKGTRCDLSALAGKRVLIVDDNKTNRNILIQQTQSLQMMATGIESGPIALKLLETNATFDLAVLDYQMPDMDGVMLAEEIRKMPGRKNLPFILLSSYGLREKNGTFTSFAATLTKPIKFSQLHNAFLMVLKKNKAAVKKHHDISSISFDSELGKKYPLRILLVEDNKVNQKVALRFLDKLGYRADVAFNGIEAIDALRRQNYNIILMDVQMPEMDGEQATIVIRKDFPKEQQPKIIAMTANALKSDRDRYLAIGMDDYIIKPFKIEELVRVLVESHLFFNPVDLTIVKEN